MLERYQSMILRLCLAHTDKRQNSINDMYQEVVGNLWKGFPRYVGGSKLSTWVYSTALNTLLLHERRQRRKPWPLLWSDLSPQERQHYREDLADSGADELVERLYELIGMLKEDDRMLAMMYIDGLPQSMIANIQGVSEEAVRKRIERLKCKLKQLYDNGQD